MIAMPKFSLLLPAVLILIVAILIIHQRFLSRRREICYAFDALLDQTFLDRLAAADGDAVQPRHAQRCLKAIDVRIVRRGRDQNGVFRPQ